jgi:hypothetical protein
MQEISDDFLLGVAGMSSTLVGLFLVGTFFYAETALRNPASGQAGMAPYIRASTLIVLLLYAIPIGVPLTLIALDLAWSRLAFALLSIFLVAANVDTIRRLRRLPRDFASPLLIGTEVVGTAAVVVLVTVPWILGGFDPGREELTLAILVSFATGFLGICAIVLTAFDLARHPSEPPAPPHQTG